MTPEPRMTVDLDELDALLAMASPVPWQVAGQFPKCTFVAHKGDCICKCDEDGHTHNAALIAALRNSAPAMSAELRDLRERVAVLEKALRPLCAYGIEDDSWADDIPEEIEDGQEAWEWRIAHTSPDEYLHWDIRQKEIIAARAALSSQGGQTR